uniref:Uncharacterized protein n=1 Tax=Sphaerodactylus townsendi TaxID=933632 RepID=A0ACB8GD31_9SAUR
MVPCVFGEEDVVLPNLDKESYWFIEQATSIMKAIGSVLNNFGNWPDLSRAMRGLELTHCPPGLCGTGIAREHFKVFNNAFWHLIKQALGNVPPNYEFAYKCFTLDFKHSEMPVDDTGSSDAKDEIKFLIVFSETGGQSGKAEIFTLHNGLMSSEELNVDCVIPKILE